MHPSMTTTMKTAFHFKLGCIVRNYGALSESWRAYFASSDASTCVIAERAMRIFTGDEPVSAIFRITVLTSMLFFFFQAEDGIRAYKVTGVQTCDLPIFFRSNGSGR